MDENEHDARLTRIEEALERIEAQLDEVIGALYDDEEESEGDGS